VTEPLDSAICAVRGSESSSKTDQSLNQAGMKGLYGNGP
jgi:hypothetical protein